MFKNFITLLLIISCETYEIVSLVIHIINNFVNHSCAHIYMDLFFKWLQDLIWVNMTLILLLLRRTISFTSILLLISLHFNSWRWGCHTRPFIAHIANTISSFTFRCRQLYFVILHKHISKNSAFDSVVHYSIQKRINTSVSESKTQRSNKCLRRNVHGICHPISLNQYKDYENRQPHHKKQEYE